MRITGTATLHASRADVWAALNDPAVLVATIPGCQRLEEVGVDAYTMTVSAGVGSIKGVYRGEVRLDEKRHPEQYVLHVSGVGTPGTVSADVLVTLGEVDSTTTEVTYDADAVVGGLIAGVGQRMISGVAKKTAAEFFAAVDDALTGADPRSAVTPTSVHSAEAGTATSRPAGVFIAPRDSLGAATSGSFRSGAVVGAIAALAGAVVGGWLAGRRRT